MKVEKLNNGIALNGLVSSNGASRAVSMRVYTVSNNGTPKMQLAIIDGKTGIILGHVDLEPDAMKEIVKEITLVLR